MIFRGYVKLPEGIVSFHREEHAPRETVQPGCVDCMGVGEKLHESKGTTIFGANLRTNTDPENQSIFRGEERPDTLFGTVICRYLQSLIEISAKFMV